MDDRFLQVALEGLHRRGVALRARNDQRPVTVAGHGVAGARKTDGANAFMCRCINGVRVARMARRLGAWRVGRQARGHIRVTAFFSSGPPSMITNNGLANPRALRSERKLSHAS